MKQLFLKSNILHIRTNEGVFEVSNPEVLTCLHIRHMPDGDWRIKTPGSGWTGEDVKWPVEWPYGVELIKQYKRREGWSDEPTARDTIGTVFARLLPKEEFKPAQPTPNFPKGGTTFTESAYKEGESKGPLIGRIIDDFKNGKEIFVPAVESSEPQEDRFNQALIEVPQDIKDQVEFEHNAINEAWELWANIAKKHNVNPQAFVFGYVEAKKKYAVSAPVESQEEMYNEVRQEYLKHRGRIWTKEEVMLKWIIENYKLITRNP